MARTTSFLTFEGQFESSVLGRFRIIRWFANLQDLAEISVPYEMQDSGSLPITYSSAWRGREVVHRVQKFVEVSCACRKLNPDILVVQPAENWISPIVTQIVSAEEK